jgi:hypothetical protein
MAPETMYTICSFVDGSIVETGIRDEKTFRKKISKMLNRGDDVFYVINYGAKIYDRGVDTGLCVGDEVIDGQGHNGHIMAQYEPNADVVRCTANGMTLISELTKV